MSLYRRGKTWWVRFTAPNGQRVRSSTRTEDRIKAQEYHDRLRAKLWREAQLGQKPDYSWNHAVLRWLEETAHKATSEKDKEHLRWLDQYLGGKRLTEITRDVIDEITQARLRDGVSNATVNRMLEVLRAILRRVANEWEWLDHIPTIRMLQEPNRRIRWLKRKEVGRLLEELPEHLRAMVRFTLATGLRQRNVVELEWSQVDLDNCTAWIHPDQAKAGKALGVPLNAEAVVVLREEQGKHPTRVFTYKGNPVKQVNGEAWKKALKRADIKNFRWHDLRHTWASWLVQEGTPLHVLQEMAGWESEKMARRYAHLATHHLREYADRLGKPRVVVTSGTKLAQLK